MSINKCNDFYLLECDICGDAAEEEFDSFQDAVDYKKNSYNGWSSQLDPEHDEQWLDVCADCSGEEYI